MSSRNSKKEINKVFTVTWQLLWIIGLCAIFIGSATAVTNFINAMTIPSFCDYKNKQ